jgi:hypothetical protein
MLDFYALERRWPSRPFWHRRVGWASTGRRSRGSPRAPDRDSPAAPIHAGR